MGILENVVALLSDRKLEVQELAAATLSGILRGAPASEGAALRGRFVEGARGVRATSSRCRRGRTGAGLTTSDSTATLDALAKRHAPVMGLKGFVLSTPYDVPRWLPEVLMSLVSVSGEPPPIKTTVARSLGEFRRTHEEVGLQECRDYFDAEQWEAIQDVTSTASYYV
jgi:proteasome activator subunit 4